MRSTAKMSEDGMFRYSLTRTWDEGSEHLSFVMLNPSTADADVDDPTIRRCISFAKRQRFGGIRVVNLFAFRATNPRDMLAAVDPIGPANDAWIREAAMSRTVVVAWGANAPAERADYVAGLLRASFSRVLCLGVTKSGAPRHPLYVRGDAELIPWEADR